MIEFINANCNDSDISEMLTGAKISMVTYKRWKKKNLHQTYAAASRYVDHYQRCMPGHMSCLSLSVSSLL